MSGITRTEQIQILTARAQSLASAASSKEPIELQREYNSITLEYRQLELAGTQEKSAIAARAALGAIKESVVQREHSPSSIKRNALPLTIDTWDLGLAGAGATSIVLAYALPASYAAIAGPIGMVALTALTAKKVYNSCYGRPEKIKVDKGADRSPSIPAMDTRRTSGLLRQIREEATPLMPEPRRSEERKSASPFKAWPVDRTLMMAPTGPVRPYFKADHHAQIVNFSKWAKAAQKSRDWSQFHHNHFDWQAFPIDHRSRRYRDKYKISLPEVIALKSDPTFMAEYREGVRLMLASWGYDIKKSSHGQAAGNGGKYAGGTRDIRIWKILKSLKLFDERDLFDRVNAFAATVGQSKRWDSI